MLEFKNILRQHLEKVIANQELAQWFDPLAMTVDDAENSIRVSFPHIFFGQWFMEAKKNIFELQLSPFINNMHIVYEKGNVCNGKSNTSLFFSAPPELPPADAAPAQNQKKDRHTFNIAGMAHTRENSLKGLFPSKGELPQQQHSFDTFISNKKNDFPLAAAREAVEKLFSPAYTPFIIYGQSGSGKTHLLEAMVNAVLCKAPEVPYFYGNANYLNTISISSFCSMPEQIVFIDDIHKIYPILELQDTLAAFIDFFLASQRLLVLCSDAHPANYPGIVPKLLSRLRAGLVVELKKPDMDVRIQYLRHKNACHNLGLSRKHLVHLAHNHHDIRAIDGALTKISAYRSLVKQQYGDVDKLIELSLGEQLNKPLLTLDTILEIVATHFSISTQDIIGKKRDKSVALARQAAMLLCRELLGLSLVRVGRIFSDRDHSSILYSLNKIKALQKSNKDVNMMITTLIQMCLTHRE